MSDTLFNISQYQSEPRPSYNTDWTDATGTDPAWDAPDLNPNLEASTQGADSDAPTGWQSADVFPITLKSGQTINVQFIPSKTGELRMHSFNFTGPISPTGFKSHFVLAILSEEFPHPRDYAQAYVQELITQMEEKPHQVMKTKRSRSVAQAQAPQGQANDNDSFTQETTMANDVAPELSHASVEVVEELSPEEAADQQRLELKVERAFYEAGKSLAELRDRRLYRSICKTFEEYCRIRFGFTYRHGNQLIAGSLVIENLQMGSIRSQNDEAQTGAVRSRILPTKLEQVKPLTTLEPEEQRQV